MTRHDASMEDLLGALRERAKELNCLYRVDEILSRQDAPLDELMREVTDAIPPGWQHPECCRARITVRGKRYQAADHVDTPWKLSADILVEGEPAGSIDVFYTEEQPTMDEGPFLKEERKLINAISERIGYLLMQRKLRAALTSWKAAQETGVSPEAAAAPAARQWGVIIDFLQRTDQDLLVRITRKMINHLCWTGVEEAEGLLQEFVPTGAETQPAWLDENRPLERQQLRDLLSLTRRVFDLASRHLSEDEVVTCIQRWIREDKTGFLLNAIESLETPLSEIAVALERYHGLQVDESELPLSVRTGMRVALLRRFFSEQINFIHTARGFVEIEDFHQLLRSVLYPATSHGRLGGKTAGLFLASRIVAKSTEYADLLGTIRVPKTWYITSDVHLHFIRYNQMEDVYNWKYREIDQIRREYPHIVQLFKNSAFPPEIEKGLAMVLDDFEDRPIIVRSSSLLEDRTGTAFSGKYKSLFLGNQGRKRERLQALQDAIAEVYSSIFSPDPIEYRAERNMLDVHEEMGIMIQEVVGQRAGKYFLPAFSGVAFSNNEFRWSARINREDGLLRIVPGLGTRAVDRLSDDYPVLIAPGQPGLKVNVTPDEVVRYSPRKADVINLETNQFETVEVGDLLREIGSDYPMVRRLVSEVDHDQIRRPVGLGISPESKDYVFTFEGLVADTPFIEQAATLLRVLEEKIGHPVDLEFAHDGENLHLLQCRSQSYTEASAPAPIPRNLPHERVLFSANRYVSNGLVPDISHVVYVDPERYAELGEVETMREVGRAVGRLNKVLPRRKFVLMGPGRWGSRGDIKLGVSVTYADISNTAMLIEVALRKGNYLPDLSFGTHFFQDLVEAQIRYLPLYPDEEGVAFNEVFLRRSRNVLADLVPEYRHLDEVVRVIDVPAQTEGQILRVLLNADIDEAVGILDSPTTDQPSQSAAAATLAGPAEDHWRWRLQMAEKIAALLDAERFGIRAVYVFGSTKNASAGPASDIDLIVHDGGDTGKRTALQIWLDGWSLCLAELNYLRTGYASGGLLDVKFVTDDDIARRTSYAAKIGAVTDPARPLPVGTDQEN